MSWKDLNELHVASVRSGDDTLFEKVISGRIAEAIWRIDNRKLSSSSSPLGNDDDESLRNLLKALGAERFSEMGEAVPLRHLVDNVLAVSNPTYIYGGRGTLKSLNTLAVGIAVASEDIDSVHGYPVAEHGPVIYYDAEMNRDVFIERSEAICKGWGISRPENLFYKCCKGIPPAEAWPQLHDLCEALKAKVAIIDSLGYATDGDPKEYKDARDSHTKYLDPMLTKGLALLVVEHKLHNSQHIIGTVAKEYHARYIFQVKDLDNEDRKKGERNVQLVNEKASFTDEGHKITIRASFSKDEEDKSIIKLEPQGRPEISGEEIDTSSPPVKVRRALEARDKQTADELHESTGVSLAYLRNRVLPEMRKRKEIFKANTKGRGGAIVWTLEDPELSSSSFPRDDEDDESSPRVITSEEDLGNLAKDLAPRDTIALDLETMPPLGWKREVLEEYRSWLSGLKKRPKVRHRKKTLTRIKNKIYKAHATDTDVALPRVISVATEDRNALVDVTQVDPIPLLELLRTKTLITHNGVFDLGVLRARYGYTHEGRIHDTQLLHTIHYYAEGGERTQYEKSMLKVRKPKEIKVDLYGTGKKDINAVSLAYAVHSHLGVLIGKDEQASDWSRKVLSGEQVAYAIQDTAILVELYRVLAEKLSELGMDEIVELESRTFTAMVDMSLNGFPADREVALEMSKRYREEAETALQVAMDLAPKNEEGWNLNAKADVLAILEVLGVTFSGKYPKTEKTGDPSTSEAHLKIIKKPKEAVQWIRAYLDYKKLQKLESTFANQYASLIREDGTIKGAFDTVSTGRFSCEKPNLQQVPKRGHLQRREGMRIRDIFRPPEGEKFIVADFSQVELLLAGTIAARETGMHGHMLEVFQKGTVDIHTATAASVLDKDTLEVTDDERNLAKAVNFGLLYGQKAEGLKDFARNNYGVKMSLKEAEEYREAFFERYPELDSWHRLVEAQCRQGDEFSRTPMGRQRKLPVWKNQTDTPAHTAAKNAPVQGTGADAIKLTMAKLFEDRSNCPGNPRLNASVHDEVVLSVEADHAEEAIEWVRAHMAAAEREAVVDPKSPVTVDVEAKDSWS